MSKRLGAKCILVLRVMWCLYVKYYWSSDYEFSLQLYFLSIKAAYLCSNIEKTHILLKKILEEGCYLGDKLKAQCLSSLFYTEKENAAKFVDCKFLMTY